jgi:hypothetical protein
VVLLSRLIILTMYAGGAFLFGIALGERGELGFVQKVFAGVIPLTTLMLTVLAKSGRMNVLLTGAAMLAGLLLGQRAFRQAWDECLAEGTKVRMAIVQYHAQTDGYPARLEELEGDLPCDCIVRDTILHYLSNDRAFRLWMSNEAEVVTFTASGRSSSRSPTPAPRTR